MKYKLFILVTILALVAAKAYGSLEPIKVSTEEKSLTFELFDGKAKCQTHHLEDYHRVVACVYKDLGGKDFEVEAY